MPLIVSHISSLPAFDFRRNFKCIWNEFLCIKNLKNVYSSFETVRYQKIWKERRKIEVFKYSMVPNFLFLCISKILLCRMPLALHFFINWFNIGNYRSSIHSCFLPWWNKYQRGKQIKESLIKTFDANWKWGKWFLKSSKIKNIFVYENLLIIPSVWFV